MKDLNRNEIERAQINNEFSNNSAQSKLLGAINVFF